MNKLVKFYKFLKLFSISNTFGDRKNLPVPEVYGRVTRTGGTLFFSGRVPLSRRRLVVARVDVGVGGTQLVVNVVVVDPVVVQKPGRRRGPANSNFLHGDKKRLLLFLLTVLAVFFQERALLSLSLSLPSLVLKSVLVSSAHCACIYRVRERWLARCEMQNVRWQPNSTLFLAQNYF